MTLLDSQLERATLCLVTPTRLQTWRKRVADGDIDGADLNDDIAVIEEDAARADAEAQHQRALAGDLRQEREALVGLRNFLGVDQTMSKRKSTDLRASAEAGGMARAEVTVQSVSGGRGSKRDAIITALSSGPMSIKNLYARLVADGVIQDGSNSYHALQVTLSSMMRKGRLDRPETGVYDLARDGARQE